MNAMNYNKCMHCSRIEKLAHSTSSDTKLYSDCWMCVEAGPFVESYHRPLPKFNNYCAYGLFSFFFGSALVYGNNFMVPYSSGWWDLVIKGSALMVLGVILHYEGLQKRE